MFYLGKLLQLSGLVTLAWALMLGLWAGNQYAELLLLGLGAVVFGLGSLALKRSGPA